MLAAEQLPDSTVLESLYGGGEIISIATGTSKPLPKAPAVATVITAKTIADMGATDLDEVLETIPGFHVARDTFFYNPIYTVRGIYSQFNPQVLMLVNGIPITNLFQGNRNFVWGGMPVQAISRIEAIRGPGSAVYGADAFAGVVNIITKTADEIDGTEVGARLGSFGRRESWLLHGQQVGGWDVAVMVEAGTTDGQSETVASDKQTARDGFISSLDPTYQPASLAPGSLNLGRDNMDLRVDASRDNWRVRAGYQGRRNVESGLGAGSLDPVGQYSSDRFNADLTWHDPHFSEHWDVTGQLSYFQTSQEFENPLVLIPPGMDFSLLGGEYMPDGVIGGPEVFEKHTRFSLHGFYSGIDRHLLRLGVGYYYGDLYDVKEYRNFLTTPSGVPINYPGGSIYWQDLPSVFIPERDRKIYHVTAQDEWAFARDWEFTVGARYDHYSDFGSTINPRLALVWQTDYDLSTKLLYGRAFRAPSFSELYNRNNPVDLGNPGLQPETIDTLELAWDYHPLEDWRGALSLFTYRMKDIIQLVPDAAQATSSTYQNAGGKKGYGLELEAEWKVSPAFTLVGNYAYQHTVDEMSDTDAGNAPEHQAYLRGDWRIAPQWLLDTQLNWVGERKRPVGDTRPNADDYALVDLTLRYGDSADRWGAAFSVRNLFDTQATEPGPSDIPGDLPLAGRSVYAEVRYRFD
ncbi:hypothetical protein JCM17961_27970 [Endothiovibrio diazotrophicus]